jgi:quercetin dioxygenase-like cupin family protein
MRARALRLSWPFALVVSITAPLASGAEPAPAAAAPSPSYAYATNGVKDHIVAGGSEWKLLIDESNLGGKELEMVEVTLPPGTTVASHTHRSLELIYVLSGTYEHEVNGKRYRLTPGMAGIVRPGDHVRHLVPQSGPAKLLIIWAPAGEAEPLMQAKGQAISPLSEVGATIPSHQ